MLHLAGGLEQLLEVLDRVSFSPLPPAPILSLKNRAILVYMRSSEAKCEQTWEESKYNFL
jgi:hypothetical protein